MTVSEAEYIKAKQETAEAEDEVMNILEPEQVDAFIRYEEARERLEKERVRVWCNMMTYYYDGKGDDR